MGSPISPMRATQSPPQFQVPTEFTQKQSIRQRKVNVQTKDLIEIPSKSFVL